jgi:hypothetical protein
MSAMASFSKLSWTQLHVAEGSLQTLRGVRAMPKWLGEVPATDDELLALLKPFPDEALKI